MSIQLKITTLFLFRHGETDWNVQERFQGHIDIPLNDKGRAQARALVSTLRKSAIEVILSSDLSRAVETAQIVAEALEIPVFQDVAIREAHLGKAQGLTRAEIEGQFGVEIAHRWRSSRVTDADISYPGGETGIQVIQRVFETMEKFLKAHPYKSIGVATHGGVIRRVMQNILPPDSPSVPIPNGVIYKIQYDHKEMKFSLARD